MPNVKATKALQKRSDAALESFHEHYAKIWGEERWHRLLLPALSQPTRYCAMVNRFATQAEVEELLADRSENGLDEFIPSSVAASPDEMTISYPLVLKNPDIQSFPIPRQVSSGEASVQVLSHWNMDLASVLAACILQARQGDRVLDLCAAPGGKSIVLAQMLWPEFHADAVRSSKGTAEKLMTSLHANEPDHSRQKRLIANMQSYLPSILFASDAVKVVRIDGSDKSAVDELPLGVEGYDKVLLDAPCSSERHIIHAHLKAASAGQVAEEMSNWKSSHTKTLAKTQLALLMTAFGVVKLGGKVLYATCSISHEENDNVIERAIESVKRQRKKNNHTSENTWKIKLDTTFELDANRKDLLETMTERTRYGRIALPDHAAAGRWGPLYFCLMQKVPYKSKTETSLEALS